MTELIVVGLAAWRIANLLVNEEGPFDVFLRFRHLVGAEEGELKGQLAKLFSCMFCASMWTAPLMWFVYQVAEPVAVIIAASSIVIMVRTYNRED